MGNILKNKRAIRIVQCGEYEPSPEPFCRTFREPFSSYSLEPPRYDNNHNNQVIIPAAPTLVPIDLSVSLEPPQKKNLPTLFPKQAIKAKFQPEPLTEESVRNNKLLKNFNWHELNNWEIKDVFLRTKTF